ncbi:mechanosensitive ion channel domain-containing protein [Nanoarchaeota archaeon]
MANALTDLIQTHGPVILQVIAILIAGYFVGIFAKKLILKLGQISGLSRITEKTAAGITLKEAGYRGTFIDLCANLVKLFIYLGALTLALKMAGFESLYSFIGKITIFLPTLLAALVVIIFGLILAEFFGRLSFELISRMSVHQAREVSVMISRIVQMVVAFIVFIIALQVLGISSNVLMVILVVLLVTTSLLLIISLKDFLPNIVAGMYLSSKLKEGTKINLDKIKGKVEKVSSVSTVVKTSKGRVRIPNKELFNQRWEF